MFRPATLLVLLAVPSLQAQAPAPADTTIQRDRLAEGIYLFRAPSELDLWTSSNTLVIINEDDVTVFDTGTRPVTNRRIIAGIRELTNKPVRTLVNSHWHKDHWSGNDEYVRAFPGLRIIATTETRDYMKRMGPGYFAGSIAGGLARSRAALDSAVRTGKKADGTPLTAEARREMEKQVATLDNFHRETLAVPRVLPNLVFRDTLVFWSGGREFRLYGVTGDATGSAVLHLPAERLLATGDVLVSPEDGHGPPPWTTNSNAITPWRNALAGLAALDLAIVVPGQGPAMTDKSYLLTTAAVFAAIVAQVDAALTRGLVTLDEVQAAVNLDDLGRRYPGQSAGPDLVFKGWVGRLVRKAYLEALDGAGRGVN